MSVTIISNNCIAGTILHDMGLPLNTPTVNLQIMPEEFPMFCKMIPLCLKSELYEYKNISDKHKTMLLNMFGGIPECPLAICRGYMIVLQHYKTFEEGIVCLDTEARGYKAEYFVLLPNETERFVSLKSIVEGKAKKCPNVRRVISTLFSRQWPYLESINQEDFAFMDYEGEEKETLIKECKKCEPKPAKKVFIPEEDY